MKKRVAGRFVREEDDAPTVKKTVAVGAPRPRHCRTFTRKRVAEVLPRIVEKFAEKAMQGSVAHAKALMTLGGLDRGEVEPVVKKRREKSFARLLLEKLERDSARQPEATEASDEQ